MNRFDGDFGWAQRCTWMPGTPGTEALVDLWFIYHPTQATPWDSYCLGAVHLRPERGVEPAHLKYELATHEVISYTLAPRTQMTHPLPWPLLSSVPVGDGEPPVPNVSVQFRASTDDRARDVVEQCARACVEGILPVETSLYMTSGPYSGRMVMIRELLDMWERGVRTTAHHYETGGHHGVLN